MNHDDAWKLSARHARLVEMVTECTSNLRYFTNDELTQLESDTDALFTREVKQLVFALIHQLRASHEERERVQRLLDGAR